MAALRLGFAEAEVYLSSRPGLIALIVIPALPIIQGFIYSRMYDLVDAYEYFELQLSNYPVLLFTLLIAAVYLPRLSDEFANGFIRAARTRTHIKTYFASRITSAAFIAFAVFSLMVITVAVMTFVIEPWFGFNTYGEFNAPENPEEQFTFSQLTAISKWLFVFVYAIWVGISAATYAVIGVLALALIGNRFLALAIPTIIYWGQSYVVAVLGLEAFAADYTIFPFSINQQPIWTVLVPWIPLLILIALAWAWVKSREFETAGLN